MPALPEFLVNQVVAELVQIHLYQELSIIFLLRFLSRMDVFGCDLLCRNLPRFTSVAMIKYKSRSLRCEGMLRINDQLRIPGFGELGSHC